MVKQKAATIVTAFLHSYSTIPLTLFFRFYMFHFAIINHFGPFFGFINKQFFIDLVFDKLSADCKIVCCNFYNIHTCF